jgi:nucleoside-diphosphate-sugar epimerase
VRVVVVGATGNVGTSLLEALAREDAVEEVLGIARRRPEAVYPKTTWAAADIRTADLRALFRGADAVVHLAWLIQPGRRESVTRSVNVEGTARVFQAAVDAGVGAVVYASSVGAYAPGPKDRAVDERWPATGISSSFYSRHKAEAERLMDGFEAVHRDMRWVRLRPGLIFKGEAASQIRRLFLGPLVPNRLVRRGLIPVVPDVPRLRFQAVHSRDVGDAYRLALTTDARGAFNVAADPVLDPSELADLLHARRVRVPAALLRAGAAATFKARLQPSEPGWVDMALGVPIMDTGRARRELGWRANRTSREALMELLDGLRDGAGAATPPLDAAAGGPLRARELLTGVGSSSR